MTSTQATATCPRCGNGNCPVGHRNSAYCTACFTSFRADNPEAVLTRREREARTVAFYRNAA